MHYRSNELKFQTSKDVKRELEKLNGTYSENLDMYKVIKDSTESARKTAKSIEKQFIKENDDLLNANPHTGIYKILDTIDEFNNLNKSK